MEKDGKYILTPKGRAFIIAVDTGLVTADEKDGSIDMGPFTEFWDRLEDKVILPALADCEIQSDRRRPWRILAVLMAATAIVHVCGILSR